MLEQFLKSYSLWEAHVGYFMKDGIPLERPHMEQGQRVIMEEWQR